MLKLPRFKHWDVQSKLIALVLTASLACLLLNGLVSFGVARQLLAETGFGRLTTLRATQAEAVKAYDEQLRNEVMTLSETGMVIDSVKRLTQAFNQLPDISEAQKKELRSYYENELLPKLKQTTTANPQLNAYFPDRGNERYLKYHYSAANNEDRRDPVALTDAKDGSAWSTIHKENHSRFARVAELFDYQDIMFVDIKTGNIVYNLSKENDLGANLLSGPYANSPAAKIFKEIKSSRDPFFLTFTDLVKDEASFGKPTLFVGTTVFDGDSLIGALLVQVSNERIDNLMTVNRKWEEVGMGQSGETFLIGEDSTFRSSPRGFLERPRSFLKRLRDRGLSAAKIEEIKKSGTPILVEPNTTPGAIRALAGRTGTATYNDYRGMPVVGAYQPIRFGPFDWALIAEIDQAELFSGVRALSRNMLLLAALLIPALTFLTLKMARAFTRPIRRLMEATEQISSGDYRIRIPVATGDEFGELAAAFNAMSDRIIERDTSLHQQAEENHRLLLSILPGSAATRLRQGAQELAETHANVSVLFAEIEGWDELSQSLPAEDSISLLKELTSALDATAESFAMEKLQDAGASYLAVSGLSAPRENHEQRAVDCALAMLAVMKEFNASHEVNLCLDIGLHAGPLTTGVVSDERLSFDIWGKTVNIARGIHESSKRNVIQVSAPIEKALRGRYGLKALPLINVKGLGEMAVWEVQETGRR